MLVLHPQISVLGGLDPEQSVFVKSEMQRLSNMTKVNTGTAYRLPKAIFLVPSYWLYSKSQPQSNTLSTKVINFP